MSIGRLLPFLVVTAACAGDSDHAQAADWTVRDSAGVTIVSNHWDGSSRGCVSIAPQPTTTVPSGPAAPPLFRVRGGAVLSDGRIAILNAGSRQVLFFGADGGIQRVVGRQGSGPGEFVNPTWLGRAPGDTLLVWDAGLMRLTTFDGAGETLGLHRVTAGDADGRPIALSGRFADGSFLVSPGPLLFFDGTPGVLRPPETYGRYDVATGVVERLAEGRGMEFVQGSGPVYVLPFGKQDFAIAHGDALVIGDNGTSVLRWHGMDGQLRRVVDWVSEPVPVTARDRREYRERFERTAPGQVGVLEGARYAADRPRFSSLRTDRAGWLWVGTYRPAWESRGGWLVFDRDGVLRCAVDGPEASFGVLEIGDAYVLGVRRNENDEESVVLHPLARSP